MQGDVHARARAGDRVGGSEGAARPHRIGDERHLHRASRGATPEPTHAHRGTPLEYQHAEKRDGGWQEEPRDEEQPASRARIEHWLSPPPAISSRATTMPRRGAEKLSG